MNDINLLCNALAEYNIEPPKQFKADGFMRWGKNSRYWAKAVNDGFIFGDYSESLSESVFPEEINRLGTEEKYKRWNAIKQARQDAEAEQRKIWQETSDRALNIWQSLPNADINHCYLLNKQVKPYNLKQQENRLVLPVYDSNGKIWSLQFISESGEKRFLSGGRKKGCYFSIGKPVNNKIYVCEGYATGASIFEATGEAVAVAFDCGNMESVVKALKLKYPAYEIGICADNDIKENAPNTGVNEARNIGNAYNLKVFIPQLKSGGKCDFNDLRIFEGLEAVRAVFTTAENLKKTETATGEIPAGYDLKDGGLYKIPDKDGAELLKIADKIEVLALARDETAKGWGKLITFKDPDRNTKTLLLPNSLFVDDGKELKKLLSDNGLIMDRPKELKDYLNRYQTGKRALTVNKTGWHNGVFILPDNEVIGKTAETVYYPNNKAVNDYKTKGSLADWTEHIGAYCQDNSRLTLAVCAAFACPLVYITGTENGGFNFIGDSSTGKSTILKVAQSVYGYKDRLNTWRATDNGLEGVASLKNDTLLILDEIGQADSGKIGDVVYMLGNGAGKARSTRTGEAKNAFVWRFFYLSSGEKDLSDCMLEGRKVTKAGQNIRLLSIPIKPAPDSYGAFETLHDKADGKELSEYLGGAVALYYGTPARRFIENVIADGFGGIQAQYKEFAGELESRYLPPEADGQIKRVFNRFCLCAFAGEYATANNITGWQEQNAINACMKCFNDWIEQRGGVENQEKTALLEQVKTYFEENAESQFYDLDRTENKVIYMAGYKKKLDGETKYYVLTTAFKNRLCTGFNKNQAISYLFAARWLDFEKSQVAKINGKTVRYYQFNDRVFESELK